MQTTRLPTNSGDDHSRLPDGVVVVMPALDEVGAVASSVQQWLEAGAARVRVVDNGSRDGTSEQARQAGAEVLPEPRRGFGAAAWRGLQSWPEDCPWVLFASADGSDRLSPAELDGWRAAACAGADLIVGDRTASDRSKARLRPVQRMGNRLSCFVIWWGWGRRFADIGSLRLVRRTAIDAMDLRDRGFGWNVEMQTRAIELGLRIVELPVEHRERLHGESKISGNFRGTVRAGAGILRSLGWFLVRHLATRWSRSRSVLRGIPDPSLHHPR
jgi:glycosyltransferase involved in cell wall biosynthesis